MKKLLVTVSLVVLGFNSFAQGYDPRVDVSRLADDQNRTYRGDVYDRGEDRSDRTAGELARLDREIRQVRFAIGDSRRVSRSIRDRFHRVLSANDHLNADFRRGNIRGWEVRQRAQDIRAELAVIRRQMQGYR